MHISKCVCVYIYIHHLEDYKGMFETPDQYVMETYHLYIKNHIYSFPNNIKTMDKCVCVHGRAKVSWAHAPGHPVQKPIELQSLRC